MNDAAHVDRMARLGCTCPVRETYQGVHLAACPAASIPDRLRNSASIDYPASPALSRAAADEIVSGPARGLRIARQIIEQLATVDRDTLLRAIDHALAQLSIGR